MEELLLSPHKIVLEEKGIPFSLIHHLLEGTKSSNGKFHDANLIPYGSHLDNEVEEINKMEQELEPLDPKLLDIRTMVDMCCIWRYDYPENVHRICSAIGGSSNTAIRLHYQVGPERRDQLIHYFKAMKDWLEDKRSSNDVYIKVASLLGEKTKIKSLLVERTLLRLCMRCFNCSFWGENPGKKVALYPLTLVELPSDVFQKVIMIEKQIENILGRRASEFLVEVGGAEPACHFKFVRRVEILLGSIGVLKWRGKLPPKDRNIF